MLKIETVIVTPFQQNCRLLWCDDTGDACVIDPGGDAERILDLLRAHKIQLGKIWLTHSHLDHCGGVKALKARTGAAVYGHQSEEIFRRSVRETCELFGIAPGGMDDCPEPDVYLCGEERLRIGSFEFEVIAAPGHSTGGLCFYCAALGAVAVGDVLFAGSIGRTDLPGGDSAVLMKSIKSLMNRVPGDTKVLSGHGPDTTLERERVTNPFLGGFHNER